VLVTGADVPEGAPGSSTTISDSVAAISVAQG